MVSSAIKNPLKIEDILKADNVVELLSEEDLSTISKQVIDDYDKDLLSCDGKISQMKDILDMAKMKTKEKTYPWAGASNVIYPLIANAGIDYGATLYPEIIKDAEVVKAKIIGNDDGQQVETKRGGEVDEKTKEPILTDIGAKQKQGKRVSTFMNYQLLDEMGHWETDIDKLGNSQPIIGNMYKRVYWDFNEDKVESELIYPDKLIINSGARDIDSAIVTHILELYPQEIMTRIRTGMYKDFDLPENEDTANSIEELKDKPNFNTKLHTFLDQFTWIDLDDDGYAEPYIVTVYKDITKEDSGNVVRIIPRFVGTDIKRNKDKKIESIKAQKELVKYGFIPSPDGSFYDIAFGELLYGLNDSINSTLNQLFDAGHLNVTGGGFMGKGMNKIKGGRITLSPGEWKMVNIMGDDLRKNIVQIPMPKPDPTLFALLGYLVEAGKNMALLRDVLSGEAAGNIQATTYIAMVEQGLKQFKSIYKRFYKSLKEELKLIYDLNYKHLSKEKYAEVLDESTHDVDVKEDFDKKTYNICPVADISMITSYQRMAQAQYLMGFMNHPNIDQKVLLKEIFEISQVDNIDKLIVTPPPQPNPQMEVEQLKAQVKMQETQMKMQETQQQMAIEVQKAQAEIEKLKTASMVDLANVAKIGQGIEDSDQEREIKVMDNIVDQQTKKIAVMGDIRVEEIKQATEMVKLEGQQIKNQQMTKKETKTSG